MPEEKEPYTVPVRPPTPEDEILYLACERLRLAQKVEHLKMMVEYYSRLALDCEQELVRVKQRELELKQKENP
jgi:hypothetical protein